MADLILFCLGGERFIIINGIIDAFLTDGRCFVLFLQIIHIVILLLSCGFPHSCTFSHLVVWLFGVCFVLICGCVLYSSYIVMLCRWVLIGWCVGVVDWIT